MKNGMYRKYRCLHIMALLTVVILIPNVVLLNVIGLDTYAVHRHTYRYPKILIVTSSASYAAGFPFSYVEAGLLYTSFPIYVATTYNISQHPEWIEKADVVVYHVQDRYGVVDVDVNPLSKYFYKFIKLVKEKNIPLVFLGNGLNFTYLEKAFGVKFVYPIKRNGSSWTLISRYRIENIPVFTNRFVVLNTKFFKTHEFVPKFIDLKKSPNCKPIVVDTIEHRYAMIAVCSKTMFVALNPRAEYFINTSTPLLDPMFWRVLILWFLGIDVDAPWIPGYFDFWSSQPKRFFFTIMVHDYPFPELRNLIRNVDKIALLMISGSDGKVFKYLRTLFSNISNSSIDILYHTVKHNPQLYLVYENVVKDLEQYRNLSLQILGLVPVFGCMPGSSHSVFHTMNYNLIKALNRTPYLLGVGEPSTSIPAMYPGYTIVLIGHRGVTDEEILNHDYVWTRFYESYLYRAPFFINIHLMIRRYFRNESFIEYLVKLVGYAKEHSAWISTPSQLTFLARARLMIDYRWSREGDPNVYHIEISAHEDVVIPLCFPRNVQWALLDGKPILWFRGSCVVVYLKKGVHDLYVSLGDTPPYTIKILGVEMHPPVCRPMITFNKGYLELVNDPIQPNPICSAVVRLSIRDKEIRTVLRAGERVNLARLTITKRIAVPITYTKTMFETYSKTITITKSITTTLYRTLIHTYSNTLTVLKPMTKHIALTTVTYISKYITKTKPITRTETVTTTITKTTTKTLTMVLKLYKTKVHITTYTSRKVTTYTRIYTTMCTTTVWKNVDHIVMAVIAMVVVLISVYYIKAIQTRR